MANWLSEIEQVYNDYSWRCEEDVREDVGRMACVLRELGDFVLYLTGEHTEGYIETYVKLGLDFSDDAIDLCVAAEESSREEYNNEKTN